METLPGGVYKLDDGREFLALNEFEIRAVEREGWRQQKVADTRLAYRLEAMRPRQEKPPVVAKPAVKGEQLAWPI